MPGSLKIMRNTIRSNNVLFALVVLIFLAGIFAEKIMAGNVIDGIIIFSLFIFVSEILYRKLKNPGRAALFFTFAYFLLSMSAAVNVYYESMRDNNHEIKDLLKLVAFYFGISSILCLSCFIRNDIRGIIFRKNNV